MENIKTTRQVEAEKMEALAEKNMLARQIEAEKMKVLAEKDELARQVEAEKMKELSEKTELLEEMRRIENDAYSTVNHCAKRVMCETIGWMKEIEHQISTDFASSFAMLTDIVSQVQHENNEGFRRCDACELALYILVPCSTVFEA